MSHANWIAFTLTTCAFAPALRPYGVKRIVEKRRPASSTTTTTNQVFFALPEPVEIGLGPAALGSRGEPDHDYEGDREHADNRIEDGDDDRYPAHRPCR